MIEGGINTQQINHHIRHSDIFVPHTIAALKLVDRGTLSAKSIGAPHGETGHTQFLPGNALKYGVDGSGDGRVDLNNMADALANTANYLRGKGWKAGKGYQEGQPNFRVIKEWNAATVYQKAIAIMTGLIEGQDTTITPISKGGMVPPFSFGDRPELVHIHRNSF